MFEKDLRKIIIFTCVFGLLGILTIMYLYEASEVPVEFFLSGSQSEGVYISSGIIKNKELKSNTLFFSLCDSSACIPCVFFNPSVAVLEDIAYVMQNNKEIKVKARFEYYYGKPELVIYRFYFQDQGDFS